MAREVRQRRRPAPPSPAIAAGAEPEVTQGVGDYEVGYKKPPKETQFQPGQSGNPNGRPKGGSRSTRATSAGRWLIQEASPKEQR